MLGAPLIYTESSLQPVTICMPILELSYDAMYSFLLASSYYSVRS